MSENSSGSDWIYLLLTLLAGFISFMKSQGAKKKKTRPFSETFFPEEEFSGEEEMADMPAVSEEKEKKSPYFSPLSFQEERSDSIHSATSEAPEEEETEVFDLRKAIISSEILKRKYD